MEIERQYVAPTINNKFDYTIFMVKTPLKSNDIVELVKELVLPASYAIFEELHKLNVSPLEFVSLPDQSPFITFWVKPPEGFRVTLGGSEPGEGRYDYIVIDIAVKGDHTTPA